MLILNKKKIKAEVKIVGRAGKEQDLWLTVFNSKGICIKLLGELSTEEVSHELFSSDYGISTTPTLLADKSSSVATMLGHGLPVICVSRPWKPRSNFEAMFPDNIYEYETNNLDAVLKQIKPVYNHISLSGVAKQFLNDIQ